MATLTTEYQLLGHTLLGTSGGSLYIRIYGKYTSQDIANNRSYVTYQSRLYYSGGYIISQGQTKVTTSGTGATSDTSNYQNFEGSSNGYFYGGETVVKTISGTVQHNDSTGVASISASAAFSSAGSWGWSGTASGTADLPTILRASEISSVSTANIGSNATIMVNRKNSSFTHTITYSFGSLSGTIVTKSSNTSISWTIPTSFYAQIPNSKTGSGTLTITTYSGNTQIGSSSTKSFSVSTNESQCKPVVDASVVDSNQTTVNVTGNNKILIAGYSTANVSYTVTPENSASIKTITVNNSSAYSGTSASAVSGAKAITKFNASTIDIVANDSRTYPTTKTLKAGTDYTLVNYIPLTFSGNVSRQTPTGDVLLLSFSGKFFNGKLGATTNTLTISWKYKEKGSSDWIPDSGGTLVQGTDYTINTSNNTYSGSNINLGSDFDYRKDYVIGIFYNDALISDSKPLDGMKGLPIINWGKDYFNVNGKITKNGVQVENGIEYYCSTLDDFKYWLINTASNGSYLVNLNIYGAISCAVVEKTNSNYLSFIRFGYGVTARQFKYINKKWYEIELQKYYDEYSTSEVKTNKVWIDGKPIYRKVVTTTQEVVNDTTISHGISNVDLIYVEKAFIVNDNGVVWNLPIDLYGIGDTTTDRMGVVVNRGYIVFKCDTTWGNWWNKVIVLEYTKTTD